MQQNIGTIAAESMDNKLKYFLISLLSSARYKWPPRSNAKNSARKKIKDIDISLLGFPKEDIGRIIWVYLCASCGKYFKDKQFHMDHVIPVVDPKTDPDFNLHIYAERLFCEEENWQCLCIPCHDIKTKEENAIRKDTKKSKPAAKRTRKSKKSKA